MKKAFMGLMIISLASITTLSCINKSNDKNANVPNELKKSESSAHENMYEPDSVWSLVWSDEFEKSYIDENNWNLQVVEAGRFNDEWQRYTNSSDNAYIEDSCLVIKAIHHSDNEGVLDNNRPIKEDYWFKRFMPYFRNLPHVLEVKKQSIKEINQQVSLLRTMSNEELSSSLEPIDN